MNIRKYWYQKIDKKDYLENIWKMENLDTFFKFWKRQFQQIWQSYDCKFVICNFHNVECLSRFSLTCFYESPASAVLTLNTDADPSWCAFAGASYIVHIAVALVMVCWIGIWINCEAHSSKMGQKVCRLTQFQLANICMTLAKSERGWEEKHFNDLLIATTLFPKKEA